VKYFCKDLPLNADIERHRKEEEMLRAKIDLLQYNTDDMSVRALRVYRWHLTQLLDSKAQITSKIGMKK